MNTQIISNRLQATAMTKKSAGRGGVREGAGRKPIADDTTTIAAVVSTDLRARLERLAEANGERLSAYVRRMLERGAYEAETQASDAVEAKPAPKNSGLTAAGKKAVSRKKSS